MDKTGYNVSNILWQIVKGFYLANSLPAPASTTAFIRIKNLEILPPNFKELWEEALVGNLEKRTKATLELIRFVLSKLG